MRHLIIESSERVVTVTDARVPAAPDDAVFLEDPPSASDGVPRAEPSPASLRERVLARRERWRR